MSSHTPGRALASVGIAAAAALVVSGVAALPARADNDKIRPSAVHSLAAEAAVATDQFIVGIKEQVGPAAAAASDAATKAAEKAGVPAERLRQTATGAQVVKTDRALGGREAEEFLAELRANPQVSFAEPDAVMQAAAVEPNDGLYGLQWDLWEDQAGLRAPGAWTVTRGGGVVVAVVDTGILPHSELNANVLPGYDMMSNASAARDGNGRDADPTDEGDWTSAGQCTGGDPASISSWHGTHVAGTIAAVGNNGIGVTGVAPEARILPLRALGPCGGYTSDIADSIVWAAGGIVAGAPVNANPARVINLSLGGINACSATYQNAINFAYNSGAAVVVAAGNSNRPAADSSPANCENVITVGATGRTGARAPYSNYGSAVDVSAPGGDMSSDVRNGILSTSNMGNTLAAEEAYEFMQGTSMAAPHVAGVAALIMSELGEVATPAIVENRLKATTRPLAGGCIFYGCGSGLVDATAALAKATPSAVTFNDVDGTANDTYTVPSSKGFEYWANGNIVGAGTYPGSGTVTVTAKILPGFSLADGAVTEWTHTFDGTVAPKDISGPVLVSSSVSPTSFNLADGPAVITVSVRLTDQTGAKAPVVTMGHSSGQSQGFGSMSLVSGDARDGVWEKTITIPQGSATGPWEVTLYPLNDVLGNSSGGFQTLATVDIAGAPADVSGPVLVSSSVSPTSFNLADGPAVITVSVRLTDQTGAKAPVVTMGHSSGQSQGFGSMSLVSGDARDGVWEKTITIPQGSATGPWEVTLYPLNDVLGNSSGGFQTLATVDIAGAPADVSGPVLVSSSVSPTSFNLADGPAVITVSVRLTDQTGAKAPVVTMGHSSGQSQGFGSMSLVSGDARDGVWEKTITIPQGSATGPWEVTLYPLNDVLGNSAGGFQTLATVEITQQLPLTPVTPAAATFNDEDGTAKDTFTVPATEGVEYLVGDKVTAAGTYPGSGIVKVTARALSDYVLAEGATAEWSHVFKATPYPVAPAAVVFSDLDGTQDDTFTVPATEGVEYLVGDKVTAAGTYPGSGIVKVTARALSDYVLAEGATAEWSHVFKATPYPVAPAAVVFSDLDGTKDDTFTVPATEGVEYLVGDKVTPAGTYPGAGTVKVTARALSDYVLAEGATAEWSHVFKATPYPVAPAAVVFSDLDGTKDDTFTVPATEGVEYLVGDKVTPAGTYPGSGIVKVTARALSDYVLAEGATAEWSHVFKATPYPVAPAAVVFSDLDGTKDDTFTVPATEGVEYLVGDKVTAAGTYPGAGTVKVTARALSDYVLAEGATAEWSHVFKATPYPVAPAAVVFSDLDGTKDDTFTVPATEGVEYLVGDKVTPAGTYPGSGIVKVTARALTDYVLAEGATAEWSHVFKATPYPVAPAAVVFSDLDGTKDDTFTVPATEGVEYLVGDKVTPAGTYPGTGTVKVTARAASDFVLAAGAVNEWSHVFKATPYQVTPAAVTFIDEDGTAKDTFTVPVAEGVEYLVGDKVTPAGTYPGAGTVAVTARAKADYALAEGAAASWSWTFQTTPAAYEPPAVSPFADVSTGQQFYREMAWLAEQKISTGWDEGNGVRTYRPLLAINRDAMAAFLYRMAGSPAYTAPAVSPFADVSTGQQFYREMAWLAEQKISTGWDEGNGVRTYRPLLAINRDAMAAFLYRMAGSPAYTAPAVSPFADVSTGQQFFKEMAWLAGQKISTGWDEGNGVRTYRPLQAINRDAMAAFLYRLDGLNG